MLYPFSEPDFLSDLCDSVVNDLKKGGVMLSDAQHQQDQFLKMIGLSSFLEQQGSLDESLDEIVAKSASLLNIRNCSIMLFREDDLGDGVSLRMFAKYGSFPAKASTEAVKVNKGIAGKVAATAQPLLVQNIDQSEYFPLARTPDSPSKSFICVPIVIAGKVIGVLNVSNPVDNRCFDYNDLNLSVFVTLLIGRSVQVIQLQNLLKSKFAQMAIMRESKAAMDTAVNPDSYMRICWSRCCLNPFILR